MPVDGEPAPTGVEDPELAGKGLTVPLPSPAPPLVTLPVFIPPPMIWQFDVGPANDGTSGRCLWADFATAGTSGVLAYKVTSSEVLQSIEFLRDGVSIRRITSPTAAQRAASIFMPRETFDRANPLRTVTYSIVATSVTGRTTRSDKQFKISPPIDFRLAGAITWAGPTSGSGTRVVRIPWQGTNVANVHVTVALGTGEVFSGDVAGASTGWGAASGTAEFAFPLTSAQFSRWQSDGFPVQAEGITNLVNTCTAWEGTYGNAVMVSTPTGDAGTDTGSDSGSDAATDTGTPSLWLPGSCSWECAWPDPAAGRAIRNYRQTAEACGGTSTAMRTEYEVCTYDGAPMGTRASICSLQDPPNGWQTIGLEDRPDVCVSITGDTTGNAQTIEKR